MSRPSHRFNTHPKSNSTIRIIPVPMSICSHIGVSHGRNSLIAPMRRKAIPPRRNIVQCVGELPLRLRQITSMTRPASSLSSGKIPRPQRWKPQESFSTIRYIWMSCRNLKPKQAVWMSIKEVCLWRNLKPVICLTTRERVITRWFSL